MEDQKVEGVEQLKSLCGPNRPERNRLTKRNYWKSANAVSNWSSA